MLVGFLNLSSGDLLFYLLSVKEILYKVKHFACFYAMASHKVCPGGYSMWNHENPILLLKQLFPRRPWLGDP